MNDALRAQGDPGVDPAAILAAVRALRDTGALARLRGELVVALVPSEEDGGQGRAHDGLTGQ